MKVAACQVPDLRDEMPRAISIVLEMASKAESHGADMAIFPECFLQGYFTDTRMAQRLAIDFESTRFQALLQELEAVQPTLVIGLIEQAGDDLFNTAVVLKHGRLVGRYRKTFLLDGEKAVFRPGDEFPIFQVADKKVGINICYDLNFPEAIRRLATQGAEVIVCPCNNMMPLETAQKYRYLHNKIRSERAIESSVWLVSADVTGRREGRISYGPTAVINPDGQVLDELPLHTIGTLIFDI